MATVCGVLPLVELGSEARSFLNKQGWMVPDGSGPVFLDERSFGNAKRLAKELSSAGADALFVSGQSSADVYMVCEYQRGTAVRTLIFSRDDQGWGEVTGTPREWERDFHFGEEEQRTLDRLTEEDSGWSEAELSALKEAYAGRDITKLPKLPPATMGRIFALLAARGIDLASGKGVVRRKGLWARLFG